MPLAEIRGFSLIEEGSPAIVLNDSDAPSARVFTLFHEYAHLALARPGICLPEEGLISESQRVETFCNRFAAALLVPRDDLEHRLPRAISDAAIDDLADRYRVSRYVVLHRLRTLGAISRKDYRTMVDRWRAEQEAIPARKTRQKGGMNRAKLCWHQRGRLFVSLVIEAVNREFIGANDASSYLGIRLTDLRKLASKVK